MYSQPLAFGPPCAGGIATFHDTSKHDPSAGDDYRAYTHEFEQFNNTTYRMYDATNGFNAPYTPPYYDGAAWAIMTFTPSAQDVLSNKAFTIEEIVDNVKQNTKYIRFELNHESGSYGDAGTSGPQGFSINKNAMQVDASLNLF